jgi:hypothetical protein
LVGQEQEPAVIDHQGQTAAALLLTPANPAVASAQAARGRAKKQHPQPLAAAGDYGAKELFADGTDAAQIVMLAQQALEAGLVSRLSNQRAWTWAREVETSDLPQ